MKHPELKGHLVHPEGDWTIFLVDVDGSKRWVPNEATYDNLFHGWPIANAEAVIDIGAIDSGPDITDGALLAKDPNLAPVYLIDNGTKRWITSPEMMALFHFSFQTIQKVPNLVLSYIPSGPDIA